MSDLKQKVAYVATDIGLGNFADCQISICVENEPEHRPLSDYAGPYTMEKAEAIAKRLNERLGVSEAQARHVILSTMRKPGGSKTVVADR